jgi:NtrC-family two-component system response regulator AlgB
VELSEIGTASLNVLVVDDEANIRKTLAICLEGDGHRVATVSNAQDAIGEASRRAFDMALVDLRLGTANGLDLIPSLLRAAPWMKIVVITAYASVDSAVEAMRRGAFDYLPKPFTPEQIRLIARKVGELRSLEHRVESLESTLARQHPEVELSSRSAAMQRAIDLARQVAPTDATVLLRGESGTGKSMLARAIHTWSRRAARTMAVVSCPSIPPELLESELFGHAKGAFTGAVRDNPGRIAACEGGTLLLDEVGDLPLSLQPKLLRFLQDREYERLGDEVTRRADVRIIAATSLELERAVAEGQFREELFYRLNVIQIEVPPLRQRPEDIEELATGLLLLFGRSYHKAFRGFTEQALDALRCHDWPGNVRELRNMVERAAILSRQEWLGPEDLPQTIMPREPSVQVGDPVSLDKIEEAHIRRVLASSKSLQEAAEILGIDPATLWRKRKAFGV